MNDIAPGWYPAPQQPGLQQYWDGSGWGAELRPVPPAPRFRNGLAVAALVLGAISLLGGLFLVWIPYAGVVPVAGIIIGVIALRRWRERGGRVIAHLGLWLAVASLVFLALGIANRISLAMG